MSPKDQGGQPLSQAAVDKDRSEMLDVNLKQQVFYDKPREQRFNLAMALWNRVRLYLGKARGRLRASDDLLELHRRWLGDLRGRRVLDLGCYAGNKLSLEIAGACGSYLGIDLSERGIVQLRQKLGASNLPNARAEVCDFLRPDFPYPPFDVIYAFSVLHHFRHFESFIQVLHDRTARGGSVISFDPMETSPAIWLLRRAYRPFQGDAQWEFPFSRQTFEILSRYFVIEAVQGFLGLSKWAIPFMQLPLGAKAASALHQRDLSAANRLSPGLWRCAQVALLLRRRDQILGAQPSST